jgi:hypothetical protein
LYGGDCANYEAAKIIIMRNSLGTISEVRTGADNEYLSSDCVGTITYGIESGGNVCSTTSISYKEVSLSNA